MSDSTTVVPTAAAIAAAKAIADAHKAAAERAETAAQDAERADDMGWAMSGGSHCNPGPGKSYHVNVLKAAARAAAATADRAQEVYERLKERAS